MHPLNHLLNSPKNYIPCPLIFGWSTVVSFLLQVAENIKEFFHNEGIHSTTIQPEFTDYGQIGGEQAVHDHCVLACPKGPTQESSACEASKCCPLPNGNANGNGNGKESAKSLHNTPDLERRANGFVMAKNVRTQKLIFTCSTCSPNDSI